MGEPSTCFFSLLVSPRGWMCSSLVDLNLPRSKIMWENPKRRYMAKQDPRGSLSGLGGFLGSFLSQRAVKRRCQSLRHEMRLGGPGFHAKEETSRLVIPSLLWGAQTWTKAGLRVVPSCHHLSSHPTRHAAAKAPDAGRRRRWCVLGKSRVWPKKATHGAKYRNLGSITVLKIIHCCVVKVVTRGKLSSSTPCTMESRYQLGSVHSLRISLFLGPTC